jgi:hypothetical protein
MWKECYPAAGITNQTLTSGLFIKTGKMKPADESGKRSVTPVDYISGLRISLFFAGIIILKNIG